MCINMGLFDRRALTEEYMDEIRKQTDPYGYFCLNEQIKRGEGAVQAGGGTERDANIETVAVLIMDICQYLPLSLRDFRREYGLLMADQMFPLHIRGGLLQSLSAKQRLHGDFSRTYAYQLTPGKRALLSVGQHGIEKVLHLRF